MGSAVGLAIDAEMPEHDEWFVPTIVQFELAKWLTRELGEEKASSVKNPPVTDLAPEIPAAK